MSFCESSVLRALRESRSNRRVILVALQYPTPDPLPALVLDAMRQGPGDWLWLLRFHPTSPDKLRKEIVSKLRHLGILNWEASEVCDAPLPLLLQSVDHVVTRYSSTGMEAALYGIGTTFFDSMASEYFPELTNIGIARTATSAGQILDSIADERSAPIRQVAIQHSGVDSDPGLLKEATREILSKLK